MLGHSNPSSSRDRIAHEGSKRWALLGKQLSDETIHISSATPGREYFHPFTLEPMYARLNHPTQHFCYKNQSGHDRHPVDPSERVKHEGAVHMLVKQVIAKEKRISLTVDGEPSVLQFSEVISEYRPRDYPLRRIDLVCKIALPKELATRFGNGINIEIVCHHGVDAAKEGVLKKLPYAAAVVQIPSRMLREIEAEESRAMSSAEPIGTQKIRHWEARIRGFLNTQICRWIIHIPGETDPRVVQSQKSSLPADFDWEPLGRAKFGNKSHHRESGRKEFE